MTLPLIAPYLIAAFGLSFALSMGELGATVMVYPPGWVTLPVAIFGLTDRGDIFSGAALTMILIGVTLASSACPSARRGAGRRALWSGGIRHRQSRMQSANAAATCHARFARVTKPPASIPSEGADADDNQLQKIGN